jgi:beta-aspartyl-peptidase (threonine type)
MFSLAIHGGAGTITRANMSPERELAYTQALDQALKVGETILQNGGTALDAVEKTAMNLENCELFNAGRGSVFTANGKNEMDACIMRGDTLEAGAVAGISNVKNPVQLARTIMEKSEHVFLTGLGALEFAKTHHLAFEPDTYFHTDFRYKQWQDAASIGN